MRLRRVTWMLVALVLGPAASSTANPGPALSVDAGAGRHAISPYIYGWNFAPFPLAAQIDLPVDRRGGNSADTLNWQTGVENHSNDYFFENLPTCWSTCPAGWDPPRAYTDQIDADRGIGAKTVIDVPMLGRVPKSFPDNNAVFCSFSVAKYGAQTDFDQYDPDCGNGLKAGGAKVVNDPNDTSVAVTPVFQGNWVADLVGRYNSAANGGVAFYELGNEPGLWNDTHRDWHPNDVTYNELRDKSLALAAAIKDQDPTAETLAFSEWGWPNYFCSAADNPLAGGCNSGSADRVVHGGTELAAWLLQQFKADADASGGRRLIDYFDLHYYRQGGDGIEPTRSLWDPTYTDPTPWIDDTIRLLPRMHDWVDNNYPGTKISLSEYDLSNGNVDEDNLIQADVLGIFARERLDLATLWPLLSADHYADAFRLFRNYDGAKSKFGDTYVQSQSGDQSQLAVYGAQRSSDGALTLVVLNKSTSELTSDVALAGFAPGGPAQVWRWSGAAGGIQRQADQPVAASGFNGTFAARSMTMIVIPAAAARGGGGSGPAPPASSGGEQLPGLHGDPVFACVVPKLKGLTLKKAKTKLRKGRCRLGKVTKRKSRAHKGRVIAQTPRRGAVRQRGAKVRVVLSRGR